MMKKIRRKNRFIHYNIDRINKIKRMRYINRMLYEIRHSNRNHRYYSYDMLAKLLNSVTVTQIEKFEGTFEHPQEL